MSLLRRTLGAAIGFAFVLGIAALSRVPYTPDAAGRAVLRLSWRARGERIERCRPATAQELANVPAHMRQEVICEGARVAPYQLRILVDADTLEDRQVAGSGVAGDRPMYILREREIVPGRHRLRVEFERRHDAVAESHDDDQEDRARDHERDRERDHERESSRRAVPPRLSLDTTIVVPTSTVLLITYDPQLRRLVLLGGGASSRE